MKIDSKIKKLDTLLDKRLDQLDQSSENKIRRCLNQILIEAGVADQLTKPIKAIRISSKTITTESTPVIKTYLKLHQQTILQQLNHDLKDCPITFNQIY
jgi:hypothetical protein